MMTLNDEQRRNLRDDWGDEATHSEFKPGDQLRYRKDGSTWRGSVIWCAAASESTVIGGGLLPMRYIVEREGWPDSIPDCVYSKDIVSGEPEEPSLQKCPYCGSWHIAGTIEQCPKRPV